MIKILQDPVTSMACDCGASTDTRVHPRFYGSFPRVLGRYVRGRRQRDVEFDPASFIKIYVSLAAQRASKILGIFARLDLRDRKPQYLRHMPRVWGYLHRSLSHPALEALSAWYIAHVPALKAV